MTAALEGGDVAVAKKVMVQQKKWGDVKMAERQSSETSKLKLQTWWNGRGHEFGEGFDVQKAKKVSHESELRTSTLTYLVTALIVYKNDLVTKHSYHAIIM